MPGIPRTKCCQRCKKRRTKCDERWSTCTACTLAGAVCSEPSTSMKFVHNGRHEPTPIEEPEPLRQTGSSTAWPPLVHVSSRSESHVGYSPLLPHGVGESPALRDVLALFPSTWSHFRREKTVDGLIDVKVYAKAIRSLPRAIEHSTEFAACETLAATVLLERFEHPCSQGSPDPSDDLHVCLALESQAVVQNHCLATGDENFYHTPQWQAFLDQALSSDVLTYEKKAAYRMERLMEQWPILCAKLDELRHTPDFELQAKGQVLHEQILRTMKAATSISDWITHQQYEFSAVAVPRCFLDYHACITLFNRMLHETERLLGRFDPSFDVAYKISSRHIWQC
ncbi:putative c6 zinc finger domain protein [Fusarium austroafricanum]|uniref:Putative c6 zinc finger domain protein n=1 Tax=Fusarium austroafricanum TaxID=2364996 RepID=A0A8H4KF70_9HYPO|nr:putative c6 zinc finger domain protein [Fusarium austroafricanum]